MYKTKLNKKRLKKILGSFKIYKRIPNNFFDFCSLIKVIGGDGYIPFDLYPFQKRIYKHFKKHHTTQIIKSRQMGASEEALLIACYSAIKNPAYSAVFFSVNQKATTDLAHRFRTILESITDYTETETDNVFEIKLKKGGKIYLRGASPNGAVGLKAIHLIVIDEAAVIDQEAQKTGGVKLLIQNTAPTQLTVGNKAKTLIISTPRGRSGYFYERAVRNNPKDFQLHDIVEGIRSGKINPYQEWTDKNGTGKIAFNYMAHPIFSQNTNFLEDYAKANDLTMDEVQQELNLSFESSAEAVFNPFMVQAVATGEFTTEIDDLARYYIGVDTSGDGNDYFVASVIKHNLRDDKYYFVDMYRRRKATKESHILRISELIEKYRPQVIGIEVTGNAGGLYLEDLKNRHLDTVFKEIQTTGKSKPFMIERLSYAMEKGILIIPDEPVVIEEFNSFQQRDGKMNAVIGKTDDIVMSLAFAITISGLYQKQVVDLSGVSLMV